MNKIRWLRNAVIFLCVLFVAAYFLIRPTAIQKIEPLLLEAGANRINGTLAWREIDLDPLYNLEFTDIEVIDSERRVVFKSPSLQVDWTIAGAFSAWLNGKDVSAMIQNVIAERPEIWVRQGENGIWNVQTLIKPLEEESPNHFCGRILLKNGTANVELQTAGLVQIKNMEGQFSWLNAGSISAVVNGDFSDAYFYAKIFYENEDLFSAEAFGGDIALSSLQPFLNYLPDSRPEILLENGFVQIRKAEVRQEKGKLTYSIAGDLDDADLIIDGWTLDEGVADFIIKDETANITNLKTLVNGQRITGDLDVSWSAAPDVNGQIELHNAALEQLLPGQEVSGDVNGKIHVSGPAADVSALTMDGQISLTNGRGRGLAVSDGELRFSAENGILTLHALELTTEEGHLQGWGRYALHSGDFQVQATAAQLSLLSLEPDLHMNGVVSGSLYAAGRWDGETLSLNALSGAMKGQNLSYENSYENYSAAELLADFNGSDAAYSAKFYGIDLAVSGMVIDSLSGEISGNQDDWQISYLFGSMNGGVFSLRGNYTNGQIAAGVQVGHIDLVPLAGLMDRKFGGKLTLDGEVSGTLERPEFDLLITVSDGFYQEAPFRRLASHVLSDGEWITIDSAEMETDTGAHQISGRIELGGQHALDLWGQSEKVRIEDILKLADVRAPVTGWIKNEVSIRGTMEAPEIAGHFMAWDGSAAGELYQSISAEYSYYNDGQFHVANGLAYIYGGTAVLNGTVSEQALDLDAALIDVDIERMLRQGPVRGRVTFRGRVSGAMASPVFDGGLTSRRLFLNGAEIEQIRAELSYENSVFRITDGAFRQRDGQFRWSGLGNIETGVIDGRLYFTGWSLRDALRFFQLPVSDISGAMNGGMLIHGTVDNPNVSLNVNLNRGSLGQTVMGDGRLNLSYINDILSIQECYLPIGRGILTVKGTVHKNGQMQLAASADQMDISWIPQVLSIHDMAWGGELSSDIKITGHLEDPSANIIARITQPKYNEIAFDELVLTAEAGQGVLTVEKLLASKGIYSVSAHGYVPMSALTRKAGEREVPFDIDVDLDNADLNALVFMLDSVTSASGPVYGHIKIAGPWNDPVIQGGAVVRDGRLTLDVLSEPVTEINGSLLFAGKQAELTGQANLGGGQISAVLRTRWNQSQLSGYDGELHAHMPNVKALYYDGRLDTDLLFTEERGLPKITGNINVQDAVIDIPFSLVSSGDSPDFLTDIEVNVGKDVRLYNSLLYDLSVRGNVHIAGLFTMPITSGRVNVERGTIKYLANEFVVTEGAAIWGGVSESLLPILNVKANTSVGHYKVGMDLQGPPGGFVFRMHSEPALNDTQIITLLTLRQAPGSASDEDNTTSALFNAGLSMAFSGGVQDLIRNTLGLDLISVTSTLTDYYTSSDYALNNDYYYIKIGKYLFNDFMLTATMGVNNEEQSYGFRYDLKSRIGIVAWYNNDHDSYIGTDYQFQF